MHHLTSRAGWRLLVQFALLTAIVVAVVLWVDLRTVVAQLGALSAAPLGIALTLALACRFVMGYKWRQLIHAAGEALSLRTAVSVYFQSAFSSRVVPIGVGGDLLRAWLVRRAGVSGGVVLGSMAVEKVTALLSNVALAAMGALLLVGHLRRDADDALLWVVGGGIAAASAAVALLLWLPTWRGAERARARLPRRVSELAGTTSAAIGGYRRTPGALALHFALAVLEQSLQILKLFVIGRALGVELPAVEFLAALMVVLFARRAAGYVEGLGLAEGVSIVALTLLGVAPETAVAMAVTNYAVSTVALLPGAWLLWRNRLDLRTEKGAAHPAAGR